MVVLIWFNIISSDLRMDFMGNDAGLIYTVFISCNVFFCGGSHLNSCSLIYGLINV